jgi:hypothetical protein
MGLATRVMPEKQASQIAATVKNLVTREGA